MNTNGIGLGLFICKQLTQSFEGNISLLQSQIGVGTTFTFTFLTQGPPIVVQALDTLDNPEGS